MLAQTWNFLFRLSMNKSEQPDMNICTLQQHAAWFRAFYFRFTEVPQPYTQLVSSSVSWRQDLWSYLLLFSSHGELSRPPWATVVQLKPKYLCLSTLKNYRSTDGSHASPIIYSMRKKASTVSDASVCSSAYYYFSFSCHSGLGSKDFWMRMSQTVSNILGERVDQLNYRLKHFYYLQSSYVWQNCACRFLCCLTCIHFLFLEF